MSKEPLCIKIFKMYPDVPDLAFATEESACFDLRAYLKPDTKLQSWSNNNTEKYKFTKVPLFGPNKGKAYVEIYPGERVFIPTGIKFDIPKGFSVRIHPRSSVAIKRGLSNPNYEGVIDSDYFKECHIVLENNSNIIEVIYDGDRVFQAEMVPVLKYKLAVTTEEPEQRTNRVGGFGSTGVN